ERVVGEARGGILLGERVVVRDGLLGLARRGVARGDAEAGGRHGLARVAALDHALEDGLLVDAAAELGRGLRLDEAGGAAELAAGTDGRAARPRMRELEALGAHEALRFFEEALSFAALGGLRGLRFGGLGGEALDVPLGPGREDVIVGHLAIGAEGELAIARLSGEARGGVGDL